MKVVIVGAGVAGLRTAMLLQRLGVSVSVIEARSRVGGRLCTVPVDGGFYEAGGEWIDADHFRVLSLLDELGLEAERQEGRRSYFFDGMLSEGLWQQAEEANARLKSAGRVGGSLGCLLDSVATDERTRRYLEAVALSDEGTDSRNVDLAEWLRFSRQYEGRGDENEEMSAYRFAGGASRMCEAMALGIEVVLGEELVAVEAGPTLVFASGRREACDACVLTLPPPCLSRISGTPNVAEPYYMSETCKVALQYSSDGFGACSSLLSDLPVQQVWSGGRDGAHVLTCYVNGSGRARLLAESDPVQVARECVEPLCGGPRSFISGRIHDWVEDPFAGGGFPYLPVGEVKPSVPRGGPVWYAGDWAAEWTGFIEGALESAENAVEEMRNEYSLS
ncbi:MAG TPA: NAD(P)/FAD-dependent oxidoreductase [Fimbriimonadaceae bacterium]|nr:NAD(P)/FAD-dependent oxidoreductase [Fimbriimonadaceae bacterium]